MSTPKTWDLMLACQACLVGISTANGYYTNAGATVSLEPGQIPADAGLAVAVVMDNLRAVTDGVATNTLQSVEILVFAKVSTLQTDAQLRLHELIDDVKTAFINQQTLFAVGTTFPRLLTARPIPPQDGMLFVGVEMRFVSQIRYR